MTLTSLKSSALLAAALIVCAAPLLAQKKEGDVVQTRDGKSVTLTIDAENWDALVGKGSPPIPWENVQTIEYSNGADFSKAIEAFRAAKYDAAMQQFAVLKRDTKLRKIFKQQIAFDSAYATEMENKLDEAIAAYQDVMKTYPKGRYHVQAAERTVACMLQTKPVAEGLAAVDAMVSEVSSEPGLAAAIGLIRARILMAQKQVGDAKKLFAAAASASNVPKWVVFEGQLGQATSAYLEGNGGDAKLRFQTLTKQDAPYHVLAGAWNGLGDIFAKEGAGKKDIDQLIDALCSYLRGCTIYAPVAGDPTDELERSLAGAMTCCGFIADLEPNKEKKQLYKSRNAQYKEQLKQQFPNSPYLKN